MKKFLTSLLCVMLIVCFMPTMAWADVSDTGAEQKGIYLDSGSGNDTNTGESSEKAVKSLAKAVELAGENGTIYVCNTVDITSTTELKDLTIMRAPSFTGILFKVSNYVDLTLNEVTVDGNNVEGVKRSLIEVYNGELTVNGGKLINNKISALSDESGEAYFGSGGAIYANGTINLNGVTIENNSTKDAGGAISAMDGAVVNLKDTTIKGNTASIGGGIYVWNSTLKMTSGLITENTLLLMTGEDEYTWAASGAGIFAGRSGGSETTVEISGGTIKENDALAEEDGHGAAIALQSYDYDEKNYPVLRLSGTPEISGDVFLWDDDAEGPVIQITGEFTPASPIAVESDCSQKGTIVVSYSQGLEPDVSQFISIDETVGLAVSGQELKWIEKYSVPFKDENNKFAYKRIYVMPNTRIDQSLAPTPERNGYYIVGWRPFDSNVLWNFDKDIVETDRKTLMVVWGVKQPDSVSLTANKTTVSSDSSATLQASAVHENSDAAFVYSWYKDNVLLDGQNKSTLTVTEPGVYVVKVSAVLDGKTSDEVESNAVTCTQSIPYVPAAPTTPTVQKPAIEADANATVTLDSTGTAATITVADGYELADVTVNGVSKGAVTTLTGLKTGDKVVVTTKKTEEPPVVDDSARIKAGVQATTLKIYSKSLNTTGSGKGWIQVRWVKSKGFKVDGYELYRGKTKSTMKRYDTTTKTTYTNKNYLKKGSRYYYKVRGYRMINGEKVYTQWSKTIYRLAK